MQVNTGPPALHPSQYPPKHLPSKLRIAFLHPDLGLGGAERLVVDAALALQQRGHHVELFTSYHDPQRCFPETLPPAQGGTLPVHVLGDSIVPRSVMGGRLTVVCAMLRQVHLAWSFLVATAFYHLASSSSSSGSRVWSWFLLPVDADFASSRDWSLRRQLEPFDVLVIDQLSTAIPILRWYGLNRVVFYCHFPDLLLAPNNTNASSSSSEPHDPRTGKPFSFGGELRSLYRAPIDALEQATTGEADKILVNSEFTQQVFEATFKDLRRTPRVVYPAVDVKQFAPAAASGSGSESDTPEQDRWLFADDDDRRPIVLSINRFEGKKDLALALEAFAKFRRLADSNSNSNSRNVRLICAGGYDPRLGDNVRTLGRLQQLADQLGLSQYTYSADKIDTNASSLVPARFRPVIASTPPPAASSASSATDVLFLLNMSSSQKEHLLSSSGKSRVVALLYTPMYEHFGIVPLEAMAAGIPVLATRTGGPTETIVDHGLPEEEVAARSLLEEEAKEEEFANRFEKEKGVDTTGLLRPRDPDAWALALSQLVNLSPAQRALVARAGQARVRTAFSLERLGREMERACRDAGEIGYPIPYETGYKKMCAFVVIAVVTLAFGIGAFVIGPPGGGGGGGAGR